MPQAWSPKKFYFIAHHKFTENHVNLVANEQKGIKTVKLSYCFLCTFCIMKNLESSTHGQVY